MMMDMAVATTDGVVAEDTSVGELDKVLRYLTIGRKTVSANDYVVRFEANNLMFLITFLTALEY
jgi:hypothetical protein